MSLSQKNTFVAFLRGINVGGNRKIKMEELKKAFESLDYKNVKTILATGNVIFETPTKNTLLTKSIEEKLESNFGFRITVIVRPMKALQKLIKKDPFRKISLTPHTRLYITFLPDKAREKSSLQIPYESLAKDFTIILVSPTEVCSVLVLSETHRTTDAMTVLEKEFGRDITTRNWNTVKKIAVV